MSESEMKAARFVEIIHHEFADYTRADILGGVARLLDGMNLHNECNSKQVISTLKIVGEILKLKEK